MLKQNTDLGTSGGLTLGASPRIDTTCRGPGIQRGPWTSQTYGFNWNERSIAGINDACGSDPLSVLLSTTEQDVLGENSNGGHNLIRPSITGSAEGRAHEHPVGESTQRQEIRGTTPSWTRRHSSIATTGCRTASGTARCSTTRSRTSARWKPALTSSRRVRLNRNSDDDVTVQWREPVDDVEAATQTELERGRPTR